MKLILQSAAIPWTLSEEGVQIVLVTNSKRTHWIYPKGVIEPDMSPAESAAEEALEEAGVVGMIDEVVLGTYWYEKWSSDCRVDVYPLRVTEIMEDWDEKGLRDRKIVSFDEAREMVKEEQFPCLERLTEYLEAERQ